jgi:hypothetical protein
VCSEQGAADARVSPRASGEGPRSDTQPLSVLVQALVVDLRELASAEIALAKAQLESVGIYVLLALAVATASFVLVTLALASAAAASVLTLGWGASAALAAASATVVLISGGGVLLCFRALAAYRSETQTKTAVRTTDGGIA